jgi:hypothetical protein
VAFLVIYFGVLGVHKSRFPALSASLKKKYGDISDTLKKEVF